MSWVGVGTAAIGAGASLFGSSKAKKAQKKATEQALLEQQRQYNLTRADNMPALNARNNALASMQGLAERYGDGPSMQDVQNEPGYQFGLKQGQNALEGSAAARGGLYSGNTGKALQQYGNDYASTKYGEAWTRQRANQGDAFDRYRSLATGGQAGASTIAAAGQNSANNMSDLYSAQGNANAASSIANANTYGGLVNKIGSAWGSSEPPPPKALAMGSYQINPVLPGEFGRADGGPVVAPSASAPANDPALMRRLSERLDQLLAEQRARQGGMGSRIAPTDRLNLAERKALGYADGGPVEPVVGTRSPVRTGGGGGMSHSALLTAMIQQRLAERQQAQQPQQPMPNPINPRAVLAERERRANFMDGGEVEGPGGPRDDMIPAHLSDGEHVMDEASVTALGEGDNMLGQHKLNQLRAMLKGAGYGR